MAAPTLYQKIFDEQARKLCLLGYTDKELANFFCVTKQTINNWKKEHPSFYEALQSGKDIADAEIASALYRRASGMTCKEIKTKSDGTEEVIVKEFPPDPLSMKFWLINRQRKSGKWLDKQQEESSSESKQVYVHNSLYIPNSIKDKKEQDGD